MLTAFKFAPEILELFKDPGTNPYDEEYPFIVRDNKIIESLICLSGIYIYRKSLTDYRVITDVIYNCLRNSNSEFWNTYQKLIETASHADIYSTICQSYTLPNRERFRMWMADRNIPSYILVLYDYIASIVNGTNFQTEGMIPYVWVCVDNSTSQATQVTWVRTICGYDSSRGALYRAYGLWSWILSLTDINSAMSVLLETTVPSYEHKTIRFANLLVRCLANVNVCTNGYVSLRKKISDADAAKEFILRYISHCREIPDFLNHGILEELGCSPEALARVQKGPHATAAEALAFSKSWLSRSDVLITALEAADDEMADDDQLEEDPETVTEDPEEPSEEETPSEDNPEEDESLEEPEEDLGSEDNPLENEDTSLTDDNNNIDTPADDDDISSVTNLRGQTDESFADILYRKRVETFFKNQHTALQPGQRDILELWVNSFLWLVHVDNTKSLIKLLGINISGDIGEPE